MINDTQHFFIIESAPDGKGIPYFIDKEWTPELPNHEFYDAPPCESEFAVSYELKAKTTQLKGDYLVDENLASLDMILLCKKLDIKNIGIPINVLLQRGKKTDKDYFLFFLLDYISILDENGSIYEISVDPETGKLNTPEERGLNKIYYESISHFEIKSGITKHLFICNEIAAPVCSLLFKQEYERLGLTGISFRPIDDSYSYSAWD